MKKLTFTLLCLVICMCTVVAQNVKVTGTVTAADDGLPIIGASVLVKGTMIGTVTDAEGRFSLDVPPEGKILQISYVGMNTQEVQCSKSAIISLVAGARKESINVYT